MPAFSASACIPTAPRRVSSVGALPATDPGVRGLSTAGGAGIEGIACPDVVSGPGPYAGLPPAGVRGIDDTDHGSGVLGVAAAGSATHGNGVVGLAGPLGSGDPSMILQHADGTGVVGITNIPGTSAPAVAGTNLGGGDGAGVAGRGATGVHGSSNAADGHGVHGENPNGNGVHGNGATGVHGQGDTHGVRGEGPTGVHGSSNTTDGHGVHGENPNGNGVHGNGATGVHGQGDTHGVRGEGQTGVHGSSDAADGHGVHGENPNGVGVSASGKTAIEAHAPAGGVGIRAVVGGSDAGGAGLMRIAAATSETGSGDIGIIASGAIGLQVTGTETAMHVFGKACFDATGRSGQTNGSTTRNGEYVVPFIPRGATSLKVVDTRITDDSIVHVVLASDPGRGGGNAQASISWIGTDAGKGFTVNLTNSAQSDVQIRYFITEPC